MRLTRLSGLILVIAAGILCAPASHAAPAPPARWVVILTEKPAVERYPGRMERTRAMAEPYRQHLRQMQAGLRPQIESTHARVTGSVQHLLNAMFMVGTPAQAAAVRKLPGVKAVVHMRQYRKADQLSLSNVAAAWSASGIGGESNAGAGIKIGIIDTGIDQTHPAFQDPTLTAPSGYPICDVQADCAFTSNKVIVARSYVSDIVYADVPPTATDLAAESRPDDLTARDLDGHGTGTASVAAGISTTYNGVTISGVAPKAFLGNYKIFGSDDVNPNGSGNIVQAVEDAVTDGMDVINLSLGGPALGGPLDQGCGPYTLPSSPIPIPSDACDPLAYELESAMENALVTVVVAAGNQGANGFQFNLGCGSPPCNNFSAPTFSTIGSPAYAPSVIAVGGIQNDVTYVQRVEISGSGVPSALQALDAFPSYDGPVPDGLVTAPVMDVTQAGDSDGLLCNALTPTALSGEIVLVLQGSCSDYDKVTNAQKAGAVGVIEIAAAGSFYLLPYGLADTSIYTFILDPSDGANLKAYVDANSGAKATLDPRPFQESASTQSLIPYSIAYFSSRGPVTVTGALKPDLVAAATDFLMPTQNYDPYGQLFNFAGYGVQQGTSFATPMVTGTAALVLQANPNFSPLQIRSALVNTASLANLVTSDGSAQASISEAGAGLLQAQNAVKSTLQVEPATISWGASTLSGSTLITSQTLTFSNTAAGAVNLTLNVMPSSGFSTSTATVQVNNASTATVTVPANGTATVTATLSGGTPAAGRYEGVISVSGGPVPFNIPYMFLFGSGVVYDVISLNQEPGQGATSFDGVVGAQIPWYNQCNDTNNSCINDYGYIAVQVIDQYGASVPGVPVTWDVTQGGGAVVNDSNYTDSSTNANGIAGATVNLGPTAGAQEFTATVNGMVVPFDGYARLAPALNTGGIVDGASFTANKAVAPGSWISVFGSNMSDTTQGHNGVDLAFANCSLCNVTNQALPMGIDGASFSFDTSSLSLPGRVNYASPTQLNIQVPWELQGQTSATVKSIVNYSYSPELTLSLAEYSPGFFVIDAANDVAAIDVVNATTSYLVTPSAPATRGGAVELYMNGLGPVSNQPADGMAASLTTLAKTPVTPTITIGGQNATVLFSGLAPGYVSLYQVNVTVPTNIPAGSQSIVCSIGGVTSKTATIVVK